MGHSRECLATVVRHSRERLFERVSHDSRDLFVRPSHDSRETFARVSHDSRDLFVRPSHDSRETFARVSHDSRANINQFYVSQFSLEMVLFMSHCADRGNFLPMCLRTSAKSWGRVCDGFATYAMTWRRFCDEFCRTKKYYMFKTFATRSRPVRDACKDFAMPCERLATVSRIDSQNIRELVAFQ